MEETGFLIIKIDKLKFNNNCNIKYNFFVKWNRVITPLANSLLPDIEEKDMTCLNYHPSQLNLVEKGLNSGINTSQLDIEIL